ncbi:MAG: response regulator transcription factor [Prolixibacteraceae bacterium]|nr:response regulator transcription factor [Prolixibacteraceae bacterium]
MNNSNLQILLVEDDSTLSFIVKDNLERQNYNVDVADNGEKALTLYGSGNYALIILDVMLPKLDGFSVAKEIRKKDEQTPILFLTARSMTEDKIAGLTIGGDDYITKPFSMEELLLKMKIFLRRSNAIISDTLQQKHEISLGEYRFIEEELVLKHPEYERRLTLKEAELVKLFASHINSVLNRDHILIKIWGSNDYFLGRSLDVFISRLRKYFSYDPNIKIVNLHGVGFRFSVKDEEPADSKI